MRNYQSFGRKILKIACPGKVFSIFGRNIQSEIIIRQGSSKKIGELING